jgi:hypothetical protein
VSEGDALDPEEGIRAHYEGSRRHQRPQPGKDRLRRRKPHLQEAPQEKQKEWHGRSLGERSYPYLYLDATYLEVRWGASVTKLTLLACCIGVNEEGFREVLVVEVASSGKGVAYASLLRSSSTWALRVCGSRSQTTHEGIKAAVASELPDNLMAAVHSSCSRRGGKAEPTAFETLTKQIR